MNAGDAGSFALALDWASPRPRRILGRALDGGELSVEEADLLATVTGRDLQALGLVADEMRRRQAGDLVTFVINRNINFTNVCVKHCTFCAFSRDHRAEEGYFLPVSEVVRRAREAWELGATEVCLQAGLPPKLDGRYYIDLRAAGLGTLPGTSAEILDQDVRDRISRGRITVAQWVEVITTAHALGIRTTSTIMYGHVETPAHWTRHLELLRGIQKDTGGFTEFVPLSLIHQEAPMYAKRLVPGVRPGATGAEVLRMHALARLMLGPTFRNIQSSWVKEGPKLSQVLLTVGANDLGGTLINESISTSAGAQFGQLVAPAELRRLVRDLGRVPAQRNTVYDLVRVYAEPAADEVSPLDAVDNADERFGSYRRLATGGEFRFTRR